MILGFHEFCTCLRLPCVFWVSVKKLTHPPPSPMYLALVFHLVFGFEPQQRLVIAPSRNINQLSCPADQFGEEVIWKEAQADIVGRSKSTRN